MTAYLSILAQIAKTISTWIIKLLKPFLKSAQLLVLFLSLLTDKNKYYPEQAVITGGETFDFIVVGGGTAGCVLANKLSQDPNMSVLLIEAGGLPSYIADIPAFFPLVDYSTEEWGFYSTNDNYSSQGVKEGKVHITAGKMLGGSSSLTYQLYTRGAKADFNRWAEMGNQGWDWESVLPFFKKAEYIDDVQIYRSNTSYLHGKNGPMRVRKPEWEQAEVYLKGFRQNGRPTLEDINGNITLGYSLSQLTIDDHFRQSTAITSIRPLKGRKNFSLLLNSFVTKIIINEDKEATGVKVLLNNGEHVVVNARREVIVCAGTLNSPKLLMLSGIGPKKHLEENGIEAIADLPSVGQNLTDTSLVLIVLTGLRGFLESYGDNLVSLTNLNMFPVPILIGHGALNKSQSYADYQMNAVLSPAGSIIPAIFCSSIFRYEDKTCISMIEDGVLLETILAAHNIVRPKSKGNVTLSCADPKAPPVIYTGFYSDPVDLEYHAQYLLDYVSVINTKIFKNFNSQIVDTKLEQCKHLKFNTIEYWKCYILNLASSQWNYSGTCAMGDVGSSVVDNRLRVHGFNKLRIVDASVIPATVGGNYVAVVTMIAEKAFAMIKEDQEYYCPESEEEE